MRTSIHGGASQEPDISVKESVEIKITGNNQIELE